MYDKIVTALESFKILQQKGKVTRIVISIKKRRIFLILISRKNLPMLRDPFNIDPTPNDNHETPSAVCNLPSDVRMFGKFVNVATTNPSHIPKLMDTLSFESNRVWDLTPELSFTDRYQLKDFVEAKLKSLNSVMYTISHKNRLKEPLGLIAFDQIDPQKRSIRFTFAIFAEQLKQSRMGAEAFFFILRYFFANLKFTKLVGSFSPQNQRLIRMALRVGARSEAPIVDLESQKTLPTKLCLSYRDWPFVKAEFESWMDDNNFDVNQRPITRLLVCYPKL